MTSLPQLWWQRPSATALTPLTAPSGARPVPMVSSLPGRNLPSLLLGDREDISSRGSYLPPSRGSGVTTHMESARLRGFRLHELYSQRRSRSPTQYRPPHHLHQHSPQNSPHRSPAQSPRRSPQHSPQRSPRRRVSPSRFSSVSDGFLSTVPLSRALFPPVTGSSRRQQASAATMDATDKRFAAEVLMSSDRRREPSQLDFLLSSRKIVDAKDQVSNQASVIEAGGAAGGNPGGVTGGEAGEAAGGETSMDNDLEDSVSGV